METTGSAGGNRQEAIGNSYTLVQVCQKNIVGEVLAFRNP